MLKRKLYWIAIGLALSHLSIAEYWNGGKARRFGDCADCGPAPQIDFPIPSNTIPKITGFTHGNAVSGVPNFHAYSTQYANTQDELMRQQQQQAPLVEPRPVSLFDMRLYNEILGLRPAERLELFQRGTPGGTFNWGWTPSWVPSPAPAPFPVWSI